MSWVGEWVGSRQLLLDEIKKSRWAAGRKLLLDKMNKACC